MPESPPRAPAPHAPAVKRPRALIVAERGLPRSEMIGLLEQEGVEVRPLAHSGQLAEPSVDLVLLLGCPNNEPLATALAQLDAVEDRPATLAVLPPLAQNDDLDALDHAKVDAVVALNEPKLLRYQVRALMRRRQSPHGFSAEQLADAQELAGFGAWEIDTETYALTCSRALLALFGLDPKEGTPTIAALRDQCHPDDLSVIDEAVAAAIESGSPLSVRHRVRDETGADRVLETRGQAVRAGETVLLRGVTCEVSDAPEAETTYLANYDALTGLANRSRLEEILRRTCARSLRQGHSFAVLHLGLDDLKRINKAFGRSFGDEVLRRVAERLIASIRVGDWLATGSLDDAPTVGRFSSDEFTVLLPEIASENDAARVARRILDAIAHPVSFAGHEAQVTGCIGISVGPSDSGDPSILLGNALDAMYQAKERGKDHFQFLAAKRNHTAYTQLVLESKLRTAIEHRDLVLNYQPRVDARTRRVTGFEALVRWTEEELGPVAPSDFIPLAESTGLIESLGRWTIEEACAQAARWQSDGLDAGLIAVNVSAKHFQEPDFGRWLLSTVEAAGIAADRFELEITESCVMESERASQTLATLRERGMKVAIDDFGTGYSSLQYLRELPIDRLKIDRSFIKDLEDDPTARRLTTAILSLAWSLGLQCVGEGVETEAQFEFLRDHGCDELQGFFFGEAVAPEAVRERLLAQRAGEVAAAG